MAVETAGMYRMAVDSHTGLANMCRTMAHIWLAELAMDKHGNDRAKGEGKHCDERQQTKTSPITAVRCHPGEAS